MQQQKVMVSVNGTFRVTKKKQSVRRSTVGQTLWHGQQLDHQRQKMSARQLMELGYISVRKCQCWLALITVIISKFQEVCGWKMLQGTWNGTKMCTDFLIKRRVALFKNALLNVFVRPNQSANKPCMQVFDGR